MSVRKSTLIDRKTLFGNPDKISPRLSFDGRYFSYLAPVDGVLNVWVGPVDGSTPAAPVTEDRNRGIRSYFWAHNNRHILYVQDKGGDENWHIYAVDVEDGTHRDLTPLDGIAAMPLELSPLKPNTIAVLINDRNPQLHDFYEIDLNTGERRLRLENPGFISITVDLDYNIRYGLAFLPDGSYQLMAMDGDGKWQKASTIPPEDTLTTGVIGFSKDGETVYLKDSRGRDTSALVAQNTKTGETRVVAHSDKADVSDILVHPSDLTIQAAAFTYDRKRWMILDPRIQGDIDALRAIDGGDLEIISRTHDDRRWVVAFLHDDAAIAYYLWDRDEEKATFLFNHREGLEGLPLSKMQSVIINASDGLPLVAYLSIPHGLEMREADGISVPIKPIPMVLQVHGGPWARDSWGYNPYHQWLNNRGYAVLSVNFRGSTGFGKAFVNAGNREWGKRMHQDLLDAVEWAIEKGITPKDKVAIQGGSYGGYATLAGLTLTPDVFTCGVDIVGPSNLITFMETIPPYWMPMLQQLKDRVGDPDTEEGRQMLIDRSPLTHVQRIKKPLLIGQGANDPRIKQAESDQIVSAMEENGIPVTYVLFPDEGHGFARPENSLAFRAVTEVFLAEHLGGRYQPIGDDIQKSTADLRAGSALIAGL